MSRPRDRASSNGLLPRMEAMSRKYGFTYRYHPVGSKPINLGHDKDAAIRRVLDMNQSNIDRGTVNELWRLYQTLPAFKDLADDSRKDYMQCSGPLLKVFGAMPPATIKPAHIARYLRVERADAPVRANREKSLLSNLFNVGIERGDLETNPCKQVRKNKEKVRKEAPTAEVLADFLAWAWSQKGQSLVLAGMAEFASIAGNRGVEFRTLAWTQITGNQIRVIRAKQHGAEVVEVIEIDGMIADLITRLRKLAKDDRHGWVFPNADGNAYTAQAFKLGFSRLKTGARKAGKLPKNFTMHDLRHYFVTEFKRKNKELPDLHADSATTSRIYDDSKEVNRRGL
jgi:integrase